MKINRLYASILALFLLCASVSIVIPSVALAQSAGGGGKPVSSLSNEELQHGCDGGYALDCGDLGQRYATGISAPKNDKTATALFQRACDGGDAFGCMRLALAYSDGLGVKADDARAASNSERACNGGNAMGCAFLGVVYANGGGGYPKDVGKAETLFSKACFSRTDFKSAPDAASQFACPALARLTGKPACSSITAIGGATYRNCYVDERAWQETNIPAPAAQVDPVAAGNVAVNAGNAAYARKDYATALGQYAAACDTSNVSACGAVGVMYIQGEGVSRSGARAAAPLATACDGGLAASCGRLGTLFDSGDGVVMNKARAFTLFNSACSRSDIQSCYNLGRLYEGGQGTPANVAQAAALYQQACNAGIADGCSSIGTMYVNGVHFARNDSQAETFYRLACSKGGSIGCQKVKLLKEEQEQAKYLADARASEANVVAKNTSRASLDSNGPISCLKDASYTYGGESYFVEGTADYLPSWSTRPYRTDYYIKNICNKAITIVTPTRNREIKPDGGLKYDTSKYLPGEKDFGNLEYRLRDSQFYFSEKWEKIRTTFKFRE